MGARRQLLAALAVALGVFALYRATLLPGVDFGDTGSFQTTAGSPFVTPRDGYPLYFAIARVFLHFHPIEPAHAVNLLSAIEGGLACGLLVLAAAELTGSLAAALAAALLFGGSYTFWSQSVIAEVYALHACFVALMIGLALRWARRPAFATLALLFAVYALGFGNHLSMILLAPGLIVFLLLSAPGGWRTMFGPRVVGVALVCAVLGALQYWWNMRALWMLPFPPVSWWDALQRFWFDVTKTDWRATMVLEVPRGVLGDYLAMYGFDLRQQFGWVVPGIAIVGLVRLFATRWRVALFLLLLWAVNAAFAFGYNVGDTHVFYLPSNLVVALLAGSGVVAVGRIAGEPELAAAMLAAYAGVRMYRDFPALDRSADFRPLEVLESLAAGADDSHAVLLTNQNWQVENGLSYFRKAVQPKVAGNRIDDVVLYLPQLVDDNRAIGRRVLLTGQALSTATGAYGSLLTVGADPSGAGPSISAVVARLPRGVRYVLCLLKPTRDNVMNWQDVGSALQALTGNPVPIPKNDYVAIAGFTGRRPLLVAGADRPFEERVLLDGADVDIRMESWLSADTIRRMGFGHVIVNRRHTLIVERGVSFVAFDGGGSPVGSYFGANIFARADRAVVSLR